MKLQAAFKLSAISAALVLTSTAFAATGNLNSIVSDSDDWNAVVDQNNAATKDQTEYQFVDLNSKKEQGGIIETLEASKVSTQLYVEGATFDKDGKITNYQELIDNNAKAYLKVGEGDSAVYYNASVKGFAEGEKPAAGQVEQHYKVEVDSSISFGVPSDLPTQPALGGLSQHGTYTKTDKETVRVVDGNFLQYGKKEEVETGKTTKAGNLTDDVQAGPDLTGNIKDDIRLKDKSTVVLDQTITVGNIYTNDPNAPGKGLNNSTAVHGLQIKDINKKDANNLVDQTATLTVGELSLKDNITGTSTVITNKDITTGKLTVGGVDVGQALGNAAILGDLTTADIKNLVNSGETLSALDTKVTTLDTKVDSLDTKVTTEVSRLDGRIDAELAANAGASTAYTDKKATETLDLAKAEDVKTLTAAQEFAQAEDVKTLTAANTYTDASVKASTAGLLDSANAYTDTRANQLNKRVDDVEQTAYRGVAIALAAQQNVPNIKPGQFAVFGGVGHYESESAFAMGVVGAINERTSISGALGVAGGSEIGGRVGVAYVFGGK